MFSRLPTASLTVADLLSGANRFRIPHYQRAFSWTREEAGQLLDDLIAASGVADTTGAEPDYFLGTILLIDASGLARWPMSGAAPAGDQTFDVVDGQQRLVTLSILASVLRDLAAPEDHELRSRLGALVARPVSGPAASQPGKESSRYRLELSGKDQDLLVRVLQGSRFSLDNAEQEGAGGDGGSTMLDVRDHFMDELGALLPDERSALATYIADQTHVVAILTADIDRAHRFFTVLNGRGRPLLKSDILKAEVLNSVPAGQERQVLAVWDEASSRLGEAFDHFFGHLRSIHSSSRPQIIAAVRTIVAGSGGAEPFVLRTMAPLADAYRVILGAGGDRGNGLPPSIENRLVYLGRLNGEEWVPAAMLAVRLYRDGHAEAEHLIAEIDRQAHLTRLLTLGRDKRARRLAEIMQAIKAGDRQLATIQLTPRSRDELSAIGHNLQALWRRNPSFCKLLLLRISDEICGRLTKVNPAELSVEHVLPQRPQAVSAWRRAFPDAEMREVLTQSLGNLALVPHRRNEAARNFDFERKRDLLARHDIDGLHLAILDDVIHAKAWGPPEIRAREARLLSLVGRMLQIEIRAASTVRQSATNREAR